MVDLTNIICQKNTDFAPHFIRGTIRQARMYWQTVPSYMKTKLSKLGLIRKLDLVFYFSI